MRAEPFAKAIYQAFGFDCCPSYLGLMSWGAGVTEGVKHRLLIAEDHSYTFKTTEQRYNSGCPLPYGPPLRKHVHAH